MLPEVALLKRSLEEYEQARQWDARCNEADNAGNVAGDQLAERAAALIHALDTPTSSSNSAAPP